MSVGWRTVMKMLIALIMFVLAGVCFAECPVMDATGDCKVDMADFAIFASEWMVEGIPEVEPIEWVYVNDPGVGSHEDFCGLMSKHETTNAQYCQFLNAALESGDITVETDEKVYGAGGANSGEDFVGQTYYDLAGAGIDHNGSTNVGAARINYNGGSFTVDSGFDDHPVTYVSWYGATAFCNYYGYRLPTEWEWQAVADYDGTFTYGCGTGINTSIANYEYSTHPDGTTAVDSFGSYGYRLSDMAGNVDEWTTSSRDPQSSTYVQRGGGWYNDGDDCSVSDWSNGNPDGTNSNVGFRVCRGNEQLIPDVIGSNQSEAETAITDVHLNVGTITEKNDITVAKGNVISQNPLAGGLLLLGGTVDLVISLGPDPTVIYLVSIDDPGITGHEGFTGEMSRFETTNAQYCRFLNAALTSGDITVEADDKVYGASGSNSGVDFAGQTYYDLAGSGDSYNGTTNGGAARINYDGGVFSVDSGFDNHPVTYVSWYGSTAFCNYYGYRLPTEWEWQAVADYDGTFTHGTGTSINNSIANYEGSTHPDGTTAVGSFGSYGYGLSDMAGNVFEWTNSFRAPQYSSYILRGGGWYYDDIDCGILEWNSVNPDATNSGMGFRVCLAGLDL